MTSLRHTSVGESAVDAMSEQQPADGRRYLTIKELSEQSGFSVTQIRRWVAAGKIAYFQPGGKGGKLRFPPDTLERRSAEEPFDNDAEEEILLPGRRPKWMSD